MEALGNIRGTLLREPESVPTLQPQGSKDAEQPPTVPQQQSEDRTSQIAQATTAKIAEAIQQFVRSMDVKLKFQVHEGTGDIMVRVLNAETGEVIREIPPEQILNLAAKIDEMVGTLLDVKT